MNAAHYPYLPAMLGDAANRVPDDDAAREGLLLACRGLSEHAGAQLPAA